MAELMKKVIAGLHRSHRDKKIDPGSRTTRLWENFAREPESP
jgi:hypothetical protein